MSRYAKNKNTFYEYTDDNFTEAKTKGICCICQKPFIKGDTINYASYVQMPGILIQHKRMCTDHPPPSFYRAGSKTFSNDIK